MRKEYCVVEREEVEVEACMSVCHTHIFHQRQNNSYQLVTKMHCQTFLTKKNKIKKNKLVHLPANNNGFNGKCNICTRTTHTTAFFPPVRSDVRTLGWLEQLAVGGGGAGVGVGLAVDVLGIIVSHKVVDVFVVGRIHVWVRRLYKVVSPANKGISTVLALCEANSNMYKICIGTILALLKVRLKVKYLTKKTNFY